MIKKPQAKAKPVKVQLASPKFDNWSSLLALLKDCFAYMDDRIDPPSSLHAMSVHDLIEKAKQERLIIAQYGDELIGCGFLALRKRTIYVGKLAVAADFRRRGIMRKMLDIADAIARENGKKNLELQTRVELYENHNAFCALGFMKVGTTKHAGFEWPTSITMQRRVAHSAELDVQLPSIGHNAGPPLDDRQDHIPPWGAGKIGSYFAWKKAYQTAWRVSPEIAMRRAQLARACGLTYEEYTSILLDRGYHLQPSDSELIAEIIARR